MSGQWEVVGKKKGPSKLPVPKPNPKFEKKPTVLKGVNLSEVLPKSQVQNLYAKESGKENTKPEKVKEPKKAQKKPETKEVKESKPKAKSIESALALINISELTNIFESSKKAYPEGPIIWLKELAVFLNQKVNVEVANVTFTSKPKDYPLNVLQDKIKSVIEKALKDAGKNNVQLFYDICLTSMATDMSKDHPCLGYKLFLQIIARTEPKLVMSNISKHLNLLKSYQNRVKIGLSLLWAEGQVGYVDFHSGFTVFEELMLPLIELKNYTSYIADYLFDLLSNIDPEKVSITKQQYLKILDAVYSKNTKHIKKETKDAFSRLKSCLLRSNEKQHVFFEDLLKRFRSNEHEYNKRILELLEEIILRDQSALVAWGKVYKKTLPASVLLMKHICDNWLRISNVINKEAFVKFNVAVNGVHQELSTKKKKEESLEESIRLLKKLNESVAAKKKSSFPYKTFYLLISLIVGGFIYADIKEHGSWQDSKTRHYIKATGVCEYTHLALNRTRDGFNWVNERIEEQFPGYNQKVNEFSAPYIKLMNDTAILTRNVAYDLKEYVLEKYPVVVQSIDSYAPGLIEQCQKGVSTVWSTSVIYCSRSIDYLKKEVFIGQLSPENMQKVVLNALNTTSQKATEYYHWLYEKVQTTIK